MKVMLLQPPSRFSKNVARDLVYGCWCKGKRIAAASFPPTTQLSIMTVLKQAGQKVVLLDAQADKMSMEQTKENVRKEAPDVLIIPTTTTTFNEDCQTLSELKTELPKLITMAYGSHVTFRPKDALAKGGLDFCVMREPEWIIRDFCRALDEGKDGKEINGLAFRSGTGIHVNPPYPWIEPLDALPIPDRAPVQDYAYFNPLVRKMPWATATTSRGCPGRCIFCTSPFFYGNNMRFNSAKRVVDEMEYLKELGYKEIFFRDETFTANRPRVMEICRLIRERGIKMSWICNGRVDTVTKEMMAAMKGAGCHQIKFGVESGSQDVLNGINKGI
ncbi:MAG: radical SAM protein, partial [Candidatus Aenigmatarchaeota archaeon]